MHFEKEEVENKIVVEEAVMMMVEMKEVMVS